LNVNCRVQITILKFNIDSMKTDSPIKTKEEDILERYDSAVNIVNGLLSNFVNGQDSVVIGINGEWGNGKSTFFEFLKLEIDIQTKADKFRNVIVTFNPWRYKDEEDLLDKFLKQLGRKLGNHSPENERMVKQGKSLFEILGLANKANPEVKSKLVLSAIAKIGENLLNYKDVDTLKKETDQRLEDNGIKLFIFLDDIDRLNPNQITDLFQLIKLNSNFKNTFFFIAFDKIVVADIFSKQYHVDGNAYLEKIVQVDFELPSIPQETIAKIFQDEIFKFTKKHDLSLEEMNVAFIWNSYFKDYFKHLRNIYRYINSIELRIYIVKDDVNLIDFLLIEAIRLFDYPAYVFIQEYKNDLTVKKLKGLDGLMGGSTGEKIESLLEIDDFAVIKAPTRSLMRYLFKLTKGIDELNVEKRVGSEDYFETYFSLRVPLSQISHATKTRFIDGDEVIKKEILKDYTKENRLHQLFKGLGYTVALSKEFESFQSYYEFHLKYCDENLIGFKSSYFNLDGWFLVGSFLSDISKHFNDQDGFEFYLEALLNSNTLSSFLIIDYLKSYVLDGQKIMTDFVFPVDLIEGKRKEIIDKYEKGVVEFSNKYFSDSEFPEELRISFIIKLHNVSNEDYISLLSKIKKDKDAILLLFKYSTTRFIGSHHSKPTYQINEEKHMAPMMTIKEFDAIISQIDIDNYSGEFKEDLKLFYNLKKADFDPKVWFDLDGQQVKNPFG
jgi:hypothetical protein